MPRYIDADALLKRMRKDPLFELVEIYGVSGVIEAEPTADVVEVVRCKDCVHLELLNSEQYYARCSWHGRLFPSFGKADTRQWFCADGERRDK